MPSAGLQRLRRLRNYQSHDFYPALVVRPLCILLLWPVADWRLLTPNRLTTAANLAKLAAAGFLAAGGRQELWAAAGLLQLGLLFDHMDGTLARYRGRGTAFGSFYDKASDQLTWSIIILALAWAAFEQTGEPLLILLAAASAMALFQRGYMKWVLTAETERLRWLEARADPEEAVARRSARRPVAPPPDRDGADWLRWLLSMAPRIVLFEEMDLFFWVGLGLVLGRLELLIWLLFITQSLGMVGLLVYRHLQAYRIDKQIQQLEAGERPS